MNLEEAQSCVGIGWAELVKECYEACEKRDVSILQVKEKFGVLRFYVGSAPQEVYDIIDSAVNSSSDTCEDCGDKGSLVNVTGWYRTLCPDCYSIALKKRRVFLSNGKG